VDDAAQPPGDREPRAPWAAAQGRFLKWSALVIVALLAFVELFGRRFVLSPILEIAGSTFLSLCFLWLLCWLFADAQTQTAKRNLVFAWVVWALGLSPLVLCFEPWMPLGSFCELPVVVADLLFAVALVWLRARRRRES